MSFAATGTKVELRVQRLGRALAPGTYVVEVGGGDGRGVIGVNGPVLASCASGDRVAERCSRRPWLSPSPDRR